MGGHNVWQWSEESPMDNTRIWADDEWKRRLLLRNTCDDAPQNDVGRRSLGKIRRSSWKIQWSHLPITPEPRGNGEQSLYRAFSRGRIMTKLHLGSRVSIPRSQGNTGSLWYIQRERSHEFYADEAVTIRRLFVQLFWTKSRTSREESRKTHP